MRPRPARNLISGLALAALLATAGPGPGETAEAFLELDVATARMLGERAVVTGNAELALRIATALLERDPEDFQALMLLAAARTLSGDGLAGAGIARDAFRGADAASRKFTAARQAASGYAQAGRYTLAALWLRRAEQHAQSPEQHRLTRRDFRYVRALNPWSVDLGFGLTPSSNINGGSNQDTLTLFGLPFELSPDAKALSGFQAHLSGGLSYRIAQSEKTQTRLAIKGYARHNWLSAESRAQAPDADPRDYDYASAALSLSHDILGKRPGSKYSFAVELGRTWYGGEALSDFVSARARYHVPLKRNRRLTFSVRADAQQNIDRTDPPLYLGEIGAEYLHSLAGGNAFQVSANLQQAFSEDRFQEFSRWQLGLDVYFAKPVLGARISVGLGVSGQDFAASRYAAEGRHDTRVSAHADLRLTDMSVYGFSPVVSLRSERTLSNIPLFFSDTTSIGLGFQSDF